MGRREPARHADEAQRAQQIELHGQRQQRLADRAREIGGTGRHLELPAHDRCQHGPGAGGDQRDDEYLQREDEAVRGGLAKAVTARRDELDQVPAAPEEPPEGNAEQDEDRRMGDLVGEHLGDTVPARRRDDAPHLLGQRAERRELGSGRTAHPK
jgi:hypothetical protein